VKRKTNWSSNNDEKNNQLTNQAWEMLINGNWKKIWKTENIQKWKCEKITISINENSSRKICINSNINERERENINSVQVILLMPMKMKKNKSLEK